LKRKDNPPLVFVCKTSAYPNKRRYKWRLLSEILSIFDLRSTKQILAQYKILPLERSIPVLKIVILSMYFCLEISYIVSELNENKKLRKFNWKNSKMGKTVIKKQVVRKLLINFEKVSMFHLLEKNTERFFCLCFSITHTHFLKNRREIKSG